MPGWVPTKPERGYVWVALLFFFLVGGSLIVKGKQGNSIGAQFVGALLVFAGFYYLVRYVLAVRGDRTK
jgi:hypothetical protein